MKCKHIQQQLLDYSEDLLDQKKRSLVEEHLHRCPACRQELDELTQTVHVLQLMPFQEPPERFWNHFTANVMRKIERIETTPQVTMPSFFFPQWKIAVAVAASIILIGGLFFYFSTPVQQPELTAKHAEQQSVQSGQLPEEKAVAEIFEGIASEELLNDILDNDFALINGGSTKAFETDHSDEMLYFLISTLTEEEKALLLSELHKMK